MCSHPTPSVVAAAHSLVRHNSGTTPGREYDFESEVEDEEDLSPRNGSWTGVRNGGETEEDQSPKCGSWTEVLSSGVGLESGTEVGTEEDRSPQWSWTGDVPESLQRVASRKLGQ